jgi:hypothetical protein
MTNHVDGTVGGQLRYERCAKQKNGAEESASYLHL